MSSPYLCDGEVHKPTHHNCHQYHLCGRERSVHAALSEKKGHQCFEVQGDSYPLPTPPCTSENSSLPTSPKMYANFNPRVRHVSKCPTFPYRTLNISLDHSDMEGFINTLAKAKGGSFWNIHVQNIMLKPSSKAPPQAVR